MQPGDRALYYRQLRETVAGVFAPELESAEAKDAATLVDRILVGLIVGEEQSEALSREFGPQLAALLGSDGSAPAAPDTPEGFLIFQRRAAASMTALSASSEPASRAKARDLARIERRYLECLDELRRVVLSGSQAAGAGSRPGPSAGEPPATGSVSAERVGAYLRRVTGSPALEVTAVELIPGGRSKETLAVALSGTSALPPHVIVRRDRPVGVLQTRAVDEFSILEVVHAHGGVPVPRPFLADADPEELVGEGDDGEAIDTGSPDTTLMVMERVTGTKAGEYFPEIAAPPPEHRRVVGLQLATALAHLHSVPLSSLSGTALDPDTAVSGESLSAAVDAMASRIEDLSGPPIATVPLARRWLLDHIGDVVPAGELCLLQSDVGLHNMLIDGDRLTALVDWEAAAIGPPARELAAAWPAATALTGWDAFARAYVDAGGRPEALDPRSLAFYRVFLCLGGVMTSRTGGDLFRTGAKRDLLTAHSGLDAHFRTRRNLARALDDAMADALDPARSVAER
jgi:aminoglycoside phosphotransferase (APT) family kinase protein